MPLALTLNGRAVRATVEPRTHLADFLREKQNLTGTHLGCEHGVCGACTVLIDGEPARSCITYAVACEGASVVTIEGLDEDEIVGELRAAFSREHALQCGYCTPGMLVSARDLVLRAEAASEQQIRVAMSGNLCRCTGYVGIIRAIASTITARRARGITAVAAARPLGPVGSGHAAAVNEAAPAIARAPLGPTDDQGEVARAALHDFEPATSFEQSFVVRHPIDQVWAFFGRLPDVVTCLPGATLSGQPSERQAFGKMRIRVGPLEADFQGVAELERDDATHSGVIRGSGRDVRSTSATRGSVRYRLHAIDERVATRVELTIGYTLTGPLAQFGRTDLVWDIAGRLIQTFVTQLEARLSGNAASAPDALRAGGLVFSVLMQRLRRWVGHLFGRGGGSG